MRTGRTLFGAMFALLIVCRAVGAAGMLIPEDRHLPPLAIQSHRVDVEVEAGVAKTHVTEVFVNHTNRRLEATFLFPLPREAALTDFALYVNGKRQSGEVMPAERAREIYEDIVRRMRDPGLLEYMGSGLIRMRVFPVEPGKTTRVEVSYSHPLPFDAGVYEYTYPMKTGRSASRVEQDLTLTVRISSRQPLKSVYCPTHEVGITRRDDYHAVAGFEQTGATLDRDFTLFYTVSERQFGLNLLTHRLEGPHGYFALMLSPRVEMPDSKIMAKDVIFVIDTSGSMQEQQRMVSARDAVTFCLKALRPADRFQVIAFSTAVQPYSEGLREASPENVREAVEWVQRLEARGGTDLCGATLEALKRAPSGDRPYLVVLVTDGKPTVGVTETAEIVSHVERANTRNVRVFPFGIAENLDVPLLDRIAETTRGHSDYVSPGREIETKIASFFGKVSHPVLADLQLDFGEAQVRDMYPQRLPDLFRGSQVVVFGRYVSSTDTALSLSGKMNGETQVFIYDAHFPASNAGNEFLPALWARRKIAYLLDQIRLHGGEQELVDEVIRLSREYGVATPFTSYLVVEDSEMPTLRPGHGLPREAVRTLGAMGAGAGAAPQAVEASKQLRRLKEADAVGEATAESRLRRVGGRVFERQDGAWVDRVYRPDMDALQIVWGSDAYFAVLDALPKLKDSLSLGKEVTIVIDGKALIVGERGREQMSGEGIRAFFAR